MRSYCRRVCGCIPASRAAIEMISTLASETASKLKKPSCSSSLIAAALPCDRFEPLPRSRRRRGRVVGQCLPGGVGELRRHVDVDRDEQVADLPVAPGDPLAA